MKTMDVSGVLSQIRALNAQPPTQTAPAAEAKANETGFAEMLGDAVRGVNRVQQEAAAKSSAFAAGDPETNIAEVMLALNRSQVSFKAMSEVRNRLVSAYQDIMNMPI